MTHRRVFTDAVLLPNGKVLVCNGAQRGVPGGTIDGGSTAKDPAYTAMLYDPDKPAGSRITPLASSNIHRCGSPPGHACLPQAALFACGRAVKWSACVCALSRA